MLKSGKTLGLGLALALGALAACVYPTERSEQVQVLIDPIPDLLRGEPFQLTARVVHGDGSPLESAEVVFSSADALIAAVTSDGGMLGVSVGTTEITATAIEFAGAAVATQVVRIHDLIEVDSVRPRLVRFGDTVSIFGAGLNPDPFLLVTLSNVEVPVKTYVPVDPQQPNRFGRLSVWVRPPTPFVAQAAILGINGLAIGPDTVLVGQRDIYEPNDTIPWDFGALDRPIRNPALAFEHIARDDSVRYDWYRFTQIAPGDRTIILRSDQVGGETYSVFFTDALSWNGAAGNFGLGPQSFTIGPSLYACQGFPFGPPQLQTDSVVIALRDLPAGQYDALAAYTRRGAYDLRIIPQYRSALPPDDAEENDFCDVAPQLTLDATRTLTIDNPRDIDWFRFTLGLDGRNVSFDVDAVEEGADLDIYVLRDELPTAITLVGLSAIGGESDAVNVALDAGDYFLVVVDFAGVPTEYTLTSEVRGAAPELAQVALPQMPTSKSRKPSPIVFETHR
jgi:hypothetical protein